ncbi:MAG: ArsR/SmtB family transcription factor [Candidatus Saccharimonadales bacterium]
MDAKTFSALAEPNRLKILEVLRIQPRSVTEIAELLNFHQPQTSKHLQALNKAGLVSMEPIGQKRIYALSKESFLQLEDWVNSFHQVWNQKFDNLDKYLKKG